MPTVLSFEEIAPFLGAVQSPALSVTLPPPYMFSLFLAQLPVKESSTSQLMDP